MQEKNSLFGRLNKLLQQNSETDAVDFVDKLSDLVQRDEREFESILKQEITTVQPEMDVMYIFEKSIKLIEEYVQIYQDSNPVTAKPKLELSYQKAFQSIYSQLLAKIDASLEKLVKLSSKKSPFKLNLWIENLSHSNSSIKAETYRVGDCIVVKCQAALDCFLTLLNIGQTGNITLLFPNRYYPNNAVKAEQIKAIPEENWELKYQLIKPKEFSGIVWTEKIKAIATLTDIQLAPSVIPKTRSVFRTIPRRNIAQDLGHYVDAISNLPSKQWTETSYQFEVRE